LNRQPAITTGALFTDHTNNENYMNEFENGIAELLEVDLVQDSDVLEDFDSWDSLTSLSIIAFIDENYKVTVSAQELVTAKTVGGIKNLIESKGGHL